jgi:hypothetical protein
MAMTVRDVEDFVQVLRDHPEWRERVRQEVLGEEILGLPARLAAVERQLELLTIEVRQLSAEVREMKRVIEVLGERQANMNGRLGNVEGQLFELGFHAVNRMTLLYRKPVELTLADLDEVLDARDAGVISQHEFRRLQAADFVFRARDGKGADAPVVYPVLEVSRTVDLGDVQRAQDRAEILGRTGLAAIPVVGGRSITAEAREFAEKAGVAMVIDRDGESEE